MPIRTVLIFSALSLTLATARTMPADPYQANGEKWSRMDNIARAYAEDYASRGNVFLPFGDGGNKQMGLRQIAGGLYVLKWSGYFGDLPARMGGAGFITAAETYLQNSLKAFAEVGTGVDDFKVGGFTVQSAIPRDFDMYLKEILPLLFAFKDGGYYDPATGTYTQLLSNRMIWEMICLDGPYGGCNDKDGIQNPDRASFSGQSMNKQAYLGWLAGNFSETENHVLMIHSWRYLINDYVKWAGSMIGPDHPRYDQRIVDLYNLAPAHYDNEGNGQLKDFVLQMLGRPLHNGMFESNAKPYEALSLQAIMNFYLGANSLFYTDGGARVKKAAQNALEYLAAKWAFQTFEGKRLASMRRKLEYFDRIGMGSNDAGVDMMGMLSGAYVFEDAWDNATSWTAQDAAGTYTQHLSRYYYGQVAGGENFNNAGAALWTAVFMDATGYQLPENIHDFMLNKRNGYWARSMNYFTSKVPTSPGEVQTRGHYGNDQDPYYFHRPFSNSPMTAYKYGVLNTSPEFNFCTPTFMNSSGGFASQYYWRQSGVPDQVDDVYNFLSVPNALVTRGDIGRYWGRIGNDAARAATEVMMMRGNIDALRESKNLWTYKNFSYGYIHNNRGTDYHVTWPQSVPAAWGSPALAQFPIGRCQFRIYDLRNLEVGKGTPPGTKHGFYLVLGMPSKSNLSDVQLYEYGRGFWEVVPGHLFGSAQALKDRVVAYNPSGHFTNTSSAPYYYKLATTGETLKLDAKMGSSVSYQSIMEIKNAQGQVQDLRQVFVSGCPAHFAEIGSCSQTNMKTMPLLDVREVDRNFNTTGTVFARANGDGMVVINNPYFGGTLTLDSRDYTNPTSY